jgi:hypothetical protein
MGRSQSGGALHDSVSRGDLIKVCNHEIRRWKSYKLMTHDDFFGSQSEHSDISSDVANRSQSDAPNSAFCPCIVGVWHRSLHVVTKTYSKI